MPRACERCGRGVPADQRCPRHPGARLLDLSRSENQDWVGSLRELRRQRRYRMAMGALLFLGFGVALWALARGHDTSTLLQGRSLYAELGLVVLASIVEATYWLTRPDRSARLSSEGSQATTEPSSATASSEQAAPEHSDRHPSRPPAREAEQQVDTHDPQAARRHLRARRATKPAAHQS